MPANDRSPSSPEPSGEDGGDGDDGGDGADARELSEELTDDLLYDPAIGRATVMGCPCVRLAGRFPATFD